MSKYQNYEDSAFVLNVEGSIESAYGINSSNTATTAEDLKYLNDSDKNLLLMKLTLEAMGENEED